MLKDFRVSKFLYQPMLYFFKKRLVRFRSFNLFVVDAIDSIRFIYLFTFGVLIIFWVRSDSRIADLFLLFLLGNGGNLDCIDFALFLLKRFFSLVEKKISLLIHDRLR